MAFEIPIKKSAILDYNSLANKSDFMHVRQSLDRNTLNNDAFHKIPPSVRANTPQTNSAPAKKQKLPTGKVFLRKGQKIPISDKSQIQIALGWNILDSRCELDASAFLLGSDGKILGDEWFIFYGQPTSPDKSVCYLTGQTDDAIMTIDFKKISPSVQKIVFSVTIYEAMEKSLNFGMTSDIYARMIDSKNNEIARFQLDECYSNVTAMVLGELYLYKGEWKFNAVGSGVAKNLADFCSMYGVNLI